MAKQSSPKKKKPTARAAAVSRSQRTTGAATARARGSVKEISQSRYPGETPLTGEDRPASRPGGKKRGQATVRTQTARPRSRRTG